MRLALFAATLLSILTFPSTGMAQNPGPAQDQYLGSWELVVTKYWFQGVVEYPEGERQRIVLGDSTLTVLAPGSTEPASYAIEWYEDPVQSELLYHATGVDGDAYIEPAASPCQPTSVVLYTGSTYYGLGAALPCVDAPCIIMTSLGCTDSPLS
ncbi:MAG: hypothetical protein AB7K71_40565, partial [Polyangiaceae bacterium]